MNSNVGKISATLTDNASNFGKAFREYFKESKETTLSVSARPNSTTTIATTSNNNESEEEVEQDEVNEDENEIDIVSVGELLQSEHDDEYMIGVNLPAHETCVSHSLNLLATTDANKACEADSTFKRTYRAGLAKCTAIWNATHRSSKASDAVKTICDKSILSPVPTRWNSQYDSISRLLELCDKLNEICETLQLPKF